MHKGIICILALAVLITMASGAPELVATRAQGRLPVVDGEVAADRAWADVTSATDFKLLGKSDPAGQATQVKVLFNDKRLYVAFICEEDQIDNLVTAVTDADGPVYMDDAAELFLAPFADPSRYYHFVVNSAGVLRDEIGQDATWDSNTRARAKVQEGSWSAELMIPLASLGLDETVGGVWRVNFCREEKPHGELSCWAPCDSGFHEPANFGRLSGMDANIKPLVAAGIRGRVAGANRVIKDIRTQAREYPDLSQGRMLDGACARHLETLTSVTGGLARRTDMAQVRELGGKVAGVEADVPVLQARLAKLPMVQAAGRKGYLVCEESTMTKVRPDRPYSAVAANTVRLSLARNEYEAAQLVVVPLTETLRKVELSVSDLIGPRRTIIGQSNIKVDVVGYVDVKRSSGRSPLEPGLYPDPLLGSVPVDIDRTSLQTWLVTVRAPKAQPKGLYRGHITVSPRNAPPTEVPFVVRVWGFTLPNTPRLRTSYGIGMGSVWSHYDVAAGPGQPKGWIVGSWTGADTEGRPDYFGSMSYDIAFDYDVKQAGARSVRATVHSVTKGSHEWPRLCYYTEPLELKPNTDYEFSMWYRTAPEDADGPSGFFGPAGGVRWEPTQGEWREGTYEFDTGDKEGIRVYLKADKVGTVWFDSVRLAQKTDRPTPNILPNPGFEKGDETARDRIYDAYMLNALQHRASPTSLMAPKISTDEEGNVAIDWGRFDEKMQVYIDNGLSAFNVHWCQLPSGWGKVEDVKDEARIKRARQLLQQTQAHLDEKGWSQLAYIYTIDEPGWQSFPQVKQAFELAHDAAPKLKTLLTYGYGASKPIEPGAPRYADLAGYVDIHVPHSDCYEPGYLKKRQAGGDEIWAYVCISAQRPYLNNWAIDYPGMDHRLLFWQLFDEDITGFLYWQATYWKVNPWQDTLTYPGGNGDGSLIYPGPDGPVNSIRFELNRDGIEDYDMLVMFRDAVTAMNARRGRNMSTDPYLNLAPLTKSWTDYSEDPMVLERRRELIGNRLDALTRVLEN